MLIYKANVKKLLDDAGYYASRLAESGTDHHIGGSQLQKIRDGVVIGTNVLDTVCRLTGKDIGDLIEYVDDEIYDTLREAGYYEKKGILAPERKKHK